MRWALLTLMVVAGGCAAKSPPVAPAPVASDLTHARAAALVFDPPVSLHQPPLQLARESRVPAAFVGFEEVSTTYHYLRVDDHQSDEFTDNYERRSISERVGVSYR